MKVRIGIGLPTRAAADSSDLLFEWAASADRGPFSSVAASDRVVTNAHEPLLALAAAIGVTRRVRLIASVIVAPTRETTLLARQAASMDALSGGRFTLGIGVGIREDDYAATGISFHRRGHRLDEQLPILRRIWAGEPLGEGVAAIGPAPARRGGPELLIGGYVNAVARRIAAWGDGFMAPGGGEPDKMQELWRQIEEAWTEAGRNGQPRWVGGSYFALGPSADEAARTYTEASYGFDPELARRRLRGIPTTPAALRVVLRRQADMGVDEYILRPCSTSLEQVDRLAEVVAGTAF